jgi:hypothetical protein
MKRRMTWIEREILIDKIKGFVLHTAAVIMWLLLVAALIKYLWRT